MQEKIGISNQMENKITRSTTIPKHKPKKTSNLDQSSKSPTDSIQETEHTRILDCRCRWRRARARRQTWASWERPSCERRWTGRRRRRGTATPAGGEPGRRRQPSVGSDSPSPSCVLGRRAAEERGEPLGLERFLCWNGQRRASEMKTTRRYKNGGSASLSLLLL